MKLSFNKVQEPGQCHTATKWQGKNFNLGHNPHLNTAYVGMYQDHPTFLSTLLPTMTHPFRYTCTESYSFLRIQQACELLLWCRLYPSLSQG